MTMRLLELSATCSLLVSESYSTPLGLVSPVWDVADPFAVNIDCPNMFTAASLSVIVLRSNIRARLLLYSAVKRYFLTGS